MTPRETLKAYAQLVRLPNVFTAWADVLMGWFVVQATAGVTIPLPTLLLFLVASTCFYWAGMVLNDVFDVEEDRRDRPFRPIPSGRVPFVVAQRLGYGLWLAGYVCFAAAAGFGPNHWIGALLFVSIYAYNRWAKGTPLGPVVMGLCRFCNVLLPAAAVSAGLSQELLLAAALIGSHVACITFLAKQETVGGDTTAVMRAEGRWLVAMAVLGVGLALMALERRQTLPAMLLGLIGFVGFISWQFRIVRRHPTPPNLQRLIKHALLGIIWLDASLAVGFTGFEGLWLLVLFLPALFLGRFVYST